jgi:hypothetical protein
MANMRIAMATRNALADVFTRQIDATDRPGTIALYTGPQPENADVAVAGQTLLAVLTFALPSAGPAIAGVNSFYAIAEEPDAPATGRVVWARIADGGGHTVFDCDVSGPGQGGTMELNTVEIVKGGPLRLKNFIVTFPGG